MTNTPIDETHQPISDARLPLLTRVKTEWKTILTLGSPILISQLAQMANGVIDTVMAGRASAEDLTGVAIGGSLWVPIFLFMMGILNATQPMISGHMGAKQLHRVMPVTWNALYIAIVASGIGMLLLFHIDPVLTLIKLADKPAAITSGYLAAFAFGLPAIFILITLRGLTDGIGQTKVFMLFSILTACINAPLNYIFIFGKFGLPAMGGIGCGWATAISQWITLALMSTYLHYHKAFRNFHIWEQRMLPTWGMVREILHLGIPIGFTIFVESVMFAVVALLLASLGPVVVAGHQIALNVVSILFMVPLSLGMALTIRISFLIGARDIQSAKLGARSSVILILAIAVFYAVLLYLFAEPIAGVYTKEADVIAVAVTLLAFGAMFQIADVLQVVAISALRGYKDTRIPMYIMLASFWGIGIPLGYALAYKDWLVPAMGAPGFWIGLIAGLSHAAFWLLIRLYIFSGRDLSTTLKAAADPN
ncbi:MATE family efflux transporter [Reinekea sp. G2M2-21]|uniref:MATE family efflux transporter n=1 Tax=Reinekea sp. G2M2-21 TaxID=2788942 RepID=UPI001E554A88|nr:MATE family efflux transporter [Reinekea sp. G2M2-21]